MKKIFVYALVFVVASCATNKDQLEPVENPAAAEGSNGTEQIDETPAQLEEVVTPQRPVYHATETVLTDLIHTKLEVSFDWQNSRMNGIAWITAKPHFYASNELILDAKGMDIKYVAMGSKNLEYTYADDILTIDLGKTYTRDDKYTVMIDYVAKPEERTTGGSAAITSDKGLYFINPKGEDPDVMPQIWTQGETEASSVWFPTIDAPNAKTTQEIFMKVDDKYATLSNGELVSSKKVEGGMRIDHWKQDLPHAPYLFMMGVGEFKVVKDSYTRPDGTKMEVNYYVEPEWESSARGIFGETPEMIRFFSDKMGVEYPWDKYHQIVVRDYVSGAMENTGAVIFGDFVYRNERELLDGNDQSTIAHELFHHWFGDLVTCESWSNLPLNESFANYSQYLWDEHRYGEDEADYYAFIEGEGYYQSAGIQGYHDLIWFDYTDKEQMFDGHSYNKGGRILHMLRNYLGDEAFFAALKLYLTDNKFKAAEFHHLRLAFEEVSGEDLNWFFDQWFLGSGHPKLVFEQEQAAGSHEVMVKVKQAQDFELSPVYKLPFEIAVFDDNGKHIHKVVVDEVNEEFRFPVTGELKGIIYDYDQILLAKTTEIKTNEQYRHQYYNGEQYLTRKAGLLNGADASEEGQQFVLDVLKDKFWHMRVLALGQVNLLSEGNKDKGIAIIEEIMRNDPKSDVRVAAITAYDQLVDGEEKLLAAYEDRIMNDKSYNVVSTSLNNLGNLNPDKAMELAKGLENEKSSKMIFGIAQLYATHGDADKYEFISKALTGSMVQGFDKLGVLNSFTMYLTRQDPELLSKSIPVYEKLSEGGGFYMGLFLPQNLTYLNGHCTAKIIELQEELEEHEKNDDALYADQTRKKIAQFEEAQKKIQELSKKLESKASGH